MSMIEEANRLAGVASMGTAVICAFGLACTPKFIKFITLLPLGLHNVAQTGLFAMATVIIYTAGIKLLIFS